MPALYRDTGYSLYSLVEDIRRGRIGLPDIQRPFVWSSTKIRDLFDSMYRGYPIGTLMLWETGADVGTRQIGGGNSDRAPQMLIVDGQQRLTSLFAVLTGSRVLTKTFDKKLIRIAFRPDDQSFEVTDAAIERDAEYIADITSLWTGGFRTAQRQFFDRLSAARVEQLSPDEQDLLEERIDRVRDLRDFRFQVVELGEAADEAQVADIFVRINSEGVQLNQADFILTLMSVHWEKGRRDLETFARLAVDRTATGATPRNAFLDPSADQMLRVSVALAFRRARLQAVYGILRGKGVESGEVDVERRQQQFEKLAEAQEKALDLTNWHEFLKCLRSAGFQSRKMITSQTTVLYTYAIWLIGRHDFGLDLPTLRQAISRWFFMVHTTGRYTSSAETALEADLTRLSDLPDRDGRVFVAELERIIGANFTNDYWEISFPNKLDTSSPRSPALSAYLAALNLIDAEALFSDIKIQDLLDPNFRPPRSIERHHLFPKAHLATLGITTTRQVNAIANMAFLDWAENSRISSKAPGEYLAVMSDAVPPERLRRQFRLHALPVGWEQLDYADFVKKRLPLMAKVTREGFDSLSGREMVQGPMSTTELIRGGESQTLELKATARVNVRTGQRDARMEHEIVRTVCGFLNSEGGILVIGVEDDGTPIGLDLDLASFGSGGDPDKYERTVRQLIDGNLSVNTAGTVRIGFDTVRDKQVSVVTVAASARPTFAKPMSGNAAASEFWVRIGNSTQQLHGDDMVQYQTDRWG